MSGPHTIEPSGRTKPCAEGCRHPTCDALARDVETEAKKIRAAQVRALVEVVLDGILRSPTTIQRHEATNALNELAALARGD